MAARVAEVALWETEDMPATMEAPTTPRARKAVMWTREDCRRLEGMGLLPERWELVQGDIVGKMGTNRPHAMIAQRINTWLLSVFSSAHILPSCSIDVAPEDNPTSEPEPDITVLNRPADQLAGNPEPADIALLVEISNTTIEHDLGPKAALYARAGIPEYWVIDINAGRIHQHRDPRSEGYASVRVATGAEALSPLAQPEAVLVVEQLLG
ncbi:MAG: Uma2 family endonuclease [Bryobacterales bacterium]|nr:Uma2 family endonuclease [Bryobacterales bacterium]